MVGIKKQMVGKVKNGYSGTNGRKYITIHETANTDKGADAQTHANLQSNGFSASWHWQVDDKQAIQSFPHTAQLWHAGDGKGNGNTNSIGIEICVNSDGNFKQAVKNASELTKKIMEDENIPASNVVQHHNWSGKNCPANLRSGGKGINWSDFKGMLTGKSNTTSSKPKPSKPSSGGSSYTSVAGSWTGQTLKQGQKGGAVRELQTMLAKNNPPFYPNKGAKNNGIDGYYGPNTADAVNRFQGYYGLSVDSMAGKEVYGQLGGKPKSSGGGGGKKMASAYKGKRVESKTNGLRFYSKASWSDSNVVGHVDKGVGFPTIVSRHKVGNGYQYKVKNSKGNVYYITASSKYVDVKGKGKKTSNKKKSSSYKVGNKVTIKNSARVYATGERIPKRVKGNTYTIMQNGKGKVLLREIMSWVKKKDVS